MQYHQSKEHGYVSITSENQIKTLHEPPDRKKVIEEPYKSEIDSFKGRQLTGKELEEYDRLRGKTDFFEKKDYEKGVRSYKQGDVTFHNAVYRKDI